MEGITRLCFGASYAVALGLELVQLVRPRPALRGIALLFGFAGLFAQTVFLAVQRPTLQSTYGSLLFLAWVLAVFYLYGTVHHRRFAWAVFVLPVVLGLVVLAGYFRCRARRRAAAVVGSARGIDRRAFWGGVHGVLILLAAVGVSVGFLASVMYLLQARRLRNKVAPFSGLAAAEPGTARRDEPAGGQRRVSAADGGPARRVGADDASTRAPSKIGRPARSSARPGLWLRVRRSCSCFATACTPAAGIWRSARSPRLS